MMDMNHKRWSYWESRAGRGPAAGTDDVHAKNLEVLRIIGELGGSKDILDAGCGNGVTVCKLAAAYPDAKVSGFDYSPGMVAAAKELAELRGVGRRCHLVVGDLLNPPYDPARQFDAIFTERSLINLGGLEDQVRAVRSLSQHVAPAGKLVLCECFVDGLSEINEWRSAIGLARIEAPWHNRYISLAELPQIVPAGFEVALISHFSGTYYFLSRVINAWEARERGEQPKYEAPINKLAYDLPALNICAQTKVVVLTRVAS